MSKPRILKPSRIISSGPQKPLPVQLAELQDKVTALESWAEQLGIFAEGTKQLIRALVQFNVEGDVTALATLRETLELLRAQEGLNAVAEPAEEEPK